MQILFIHKNLRFCTQNRAHHSCFIRIFEHIREYSIQLLPLNNELRAYRHLLAIPWNLFICKNCESVHLHHPSLNLCVRVMAWREWIRQKENYWNKMERARKNSLDAGKRSDEGCGGKLKNHHSTLTETKPLTLKPNSTWPLRIKTFTRNFSFDCEFFSAAAAAAAMARWTLGQRRMRNGERRNSFHLRKCALNWIVL